MLRSDKLRNPIVSALLFVTFALGMGAAGAAAAPAADPGKVTATSSYLDQLPPLLPRDLFFDDPEIAGAQISPDGSHISFRRPHQGVMNLWVKGADEPFETARPVTADTERPVRIYFWSHDSRYLLYIQDKAGDENFRIFAVDLKAEPAEATGVPPARDLTPLEGIRAMIYLLPKSDPDVMIVGLNDRDPALHDVYLLRISTGERKLLITNDANVAAWVADLTGEVRLAVRQTEDGGTEILSVEKGAVGGPVYTCAFEETCFPGRFHTGGERVYLESNKGEDIDLSRLLLLDVETGETELVESDPLGEVDFGWAVFSQATDELIATVYLGDRRRIYPRDETFAEDLAWLRGELPDGELGFTGATADDRRALVSVSRDVDPGSVYLWDRDARTVEKLYTSRPELPTEYLAAMQPVRYTARDGQEIPAYLTVPKGTMALGLPLIVVPHGGPWARDIWGYNSFHQFLANRGYAVFSPNFRGSTGFGKAFLNAGNLEWGTGVMQHDITDGVRYLIDEGIADPGRVAIMGGSYGGYATLAGLAFTPDLYAAGVSIVGPSNIITLIRSIPPYWRPLRKMFTMRVGDPDDPEERERLIAQSPFYHAERIQAPLLVIQGANDPRVKQAESDQIVVAMRDLEREVSYLVASDEGHGFAGRENRLAMFAAIEEFLAGQLGGRYQESVDAEVAERLAAMTVDVATVTLPELPADAAQAELAPLPRPRAGLLRPYRAGYRSQVSMAGRELAVDSERNLIRQDLDGQQVWRVSTSVDGPMGSGEDHYYLDARTLVPVRRTAHQGPAVIEVVYTPDRIAGKIQAGPQELPLDSELQAPVFGGEAALEIAVSALPLSEGYTVPLRTFDVMSQQVRLWRLVVVAVETVEAAGRRFEAFKTTLQPLDGEGGEAIFWVAREPRLVVRSETTLPPARGGARVSSELISFDEVHTLSGAALAAAAGPSGVGRVADPPPPEAPLGVTAFIGVHVVPMDRERVLANQTVLIRGERIVAMGPAGEVDVPDHARRIDGAGRYLLPGLAEMHAHVPGEQAGWQAIEEVLFLYLANGITTARGMLGQRLHLELRRRLAAGELLGPRLYTSGPSLNGNSAPDPQTGRSLVTEQRRAGYDFLKLHPGLSRETFDAIAATAAAAGIPFAGHVSADVGIPRTLEVSQASVDHLDGYMETLVADGADLEGVQPRFFGFHLVPFLDLDKIGPIAAATREAGVWNVPTQSLMEHVLSPDLPVDELTARPEMRYVSRDAVARWAEVKTNFMDHPAYDPENARRFIDVRRQLIGALHEAGAGMLLGSDAPQIFNVPGFAIHHEMAMMEASGLSPYEVLATGTRNVAIFFGDEERMGTVEEGKVADLILVEGNPLEDLGHLARPAGVMARGHWLPAEEIGRRLAAIAERHAAR